MKNKVVLKVRHRFVRFAIDHGAQQHIVKKYGVAGHVPPFVVLLNKDGSRVNIDGKDVFQGEEITSPERYASLLRKVLEKFSSEKIMRVRLTKAEFEYLSSGVFLPDNLLRLILSAAKSFEKSYVLQLSEDDADEIRDLCAEHLPMVGFDDNYDLTKEGEFLETFIDKFFIG